MDITDDLLKKLVKKVEAVEAEGQGEVRIYIKNHSIYRIEKVESEILVQTKS